MKFYTIEEIIVENPRSTLKVNQSMNEGEYIFFTSGIKSKFYNDFLCKGKNIFIATGGKANVSFYEGKAAYSTDCYSITTKPFVDAKFLFYILKSKIIEIDKDMFKGAALKHLQKKQFKNIKIKVPVLAEQQRIVAKLDEAFAKIDKTIQLTKKKIIEIEQFSANALTSIYFDKKNKNLKKLNEIVSIKGGKRLPKGKKLTTENTGFPYIRVKDFNDNGTINLNSVEFIEADVQEKIARYTISSKDVYVSIAGTIGKTGIVPKILENANLTENAVKLVPYEGVDKEFLYFFTKTTSFKKQAINQTRTAAQPKLALERLGKVEIPLFDLKNQIKIISEARNIISWMKSTKENCYYKIKHLEKLKSAILIQKLQIQKAA